MKPRARSTAVATPAATPAAAPLVASTPAELPEDDESPAVSTVDHREQELERFLRPQPPLPIPERTRPQAPAGYLAHTLLGNRIYARGGR